MNIRSKTHHNLINIGRMENAARAFCQSGEALFRYYMQLEDLNEANLSREVLAERAREAEQHARVVFSSGIEAVNELQDLGFLDAPLTDEEIEKLNRRKLTDAVHDLVGALRKRLPQERWDWLLEARELFKDTELRFERHEEGLRTTVVNGKRRAKVTYLNGKPPAMRVSTAAFFSNGPERIYVPSSALFSKTNEATEGVPAYDSLITGFASAREWMYRHVRYVTELGVPAREGGGPALVVLAWVLFIAAIGTAIAAAITLIICAAEGFDTEECALGAFFSKASAAFGYGASEIYPKTQQFQYGTNNQ
jgi:hypothetical protein